jgi:hypothetical protein
LLQAEVLTFSGIQLTDGGRVVSPMRRPHFTPRKIPRTRFSQRLSRPQGHSAMEGFGKLKKFYLILDWNQRPFGL